ncbi:PEP-CTERM sorting domain-containing protein [Noviherbaspirillum pedocola]|uniref:PEP-CTERM sorting domain-containing protein n=1 Tax=Noviherbaspirillum pedocola TaxID=2801341 RepID=A0A934SNY0_9BURK|nr:PEP-CTERM sorting domain-containing protein [Noviherbaspirillum pedocola]MBK4734026.1 PEP-CTERM sorting domain-containing protein [Noviherbaspirillum pedocola]
MSKTKQLVQVLVLAGILGGSAAAHAELISTQNITFSGSAFVTDAEGTPTTTTVNNASLGTAPITAFSSSTGVLTGVTVNLSGTQTQSTQTTATAGSGTGSNDNVTASGTGSSSVQISATGIPNTTTSVLTQADSCTDKIKNGCTGAATENKQNFAVTNAAVSAGSLNSYVGGTPGISLSAPTLSASQTTAAFYGTDSTTSTVSISGTGSVVYNYLLHALGSFKGDTQVTSLNLDFGTVFQGDIDPTLNFSVFNLANANRNGLDLDSVSGIGNTTPLTTTFSPVTALSQGTSTMFSAMLDTANLGTFNAVYTFNLSDANVGASSTWQNSTLTLNLTGKVVAVPEPLSIALLGAGLLGIAASRRRKG